MFVFLLSGGAAAGGQSGGFMEAFKENPIFLSFNLVVSAIVIAMIVERAAFQLSKYRVNSKEFFAQVKKLVTAAMIAVTLAGSLVGTTSSANADPWRRHHRGGGDAAAAAATAATAGDCQRATTWLWIRATA